MGAYALQGFSKIKPKINNAISAVSPIGELSTYAQTFTRNLAEYEDPNWPDICFVSFLSSDSETGNVTVPTNFSSIALEVSQFTYAYCVSYQGVPTRLDVANYLNNTFAGRITSISVGEMTSGAGMTMCEWVSFTLANAQTNSLKIWFTDASFTREYPNHDIIVVPPIDNLDDFFKPIEDVKKALAARTSSRTLEIIDELKKKHPETSIRGDEFIYSPASNPEYRPSVGIPTIHYGVAGDSNDIVKNAIKSYLLEHSSYSAPQWSAIFPDIFKTTEFIVLPRWDLMAIPNRTNQTGMNSPMLSMTETAGYLYSFFPTYAKQHIDQYTRITTFPFMSVSAAIFGGSDNRESKFTITDYYPDYICVGTSSTDFNRMSQKTQEWALMMNQLLMVAESPDRYGTLPHRVKKFVRGGITFISQTLDNIQYMVAVKSTFST